jgi:SOS-response transcriptional repressor LexA
MSSLAEKLRAWREEQKLSVQRLAEMVGTSRQNIENAESGKSQQPRFLLRLAEVMGVPVESLLESRSAMQIMPTPGDTRATAARALNNDNNNATSEGLRLWQVPLVHRIPSGNWRNLVDALAAGDKEMVINTTANVGSNGFALTVTGQSMISPTGPHSFPPGTVLFVNPDIKAQPGHFVVVRQKGDTEFTFKRLARDGGRWLLEPLNPRYDVLPMEEGAQICGVVVKAEINTL